MAAPNCTRCAAPLPDDDDATTVCPACGGAIAGNCARCGAREVRNEELRRCIGCGDWLCERATCSRPDHENLARRLTGRVCATCVRRREIVPRQGTGKGMGASAGVEAVERARYYLAETAEELEARVVRAIAELEAATARQLTAAGEKLGKALEDALARGAARGAADAEKAGRALLAELGATVRVARLPLILVALTVLVANAAITVGIVLTLR
jgi:hypothetical protein